MIAVVFDFDLITLFVLHHTKFDVHFKFFSHFFYEKYDVKWH